MRDPDRRGAAVAVAVCAALFVVTSSTSNRPAVRDATAPECTRHWREVDAIDGATTRAVCDDGAHGRPVRGPVRLLLGLPIELNRASARTLESLPGVGPSRAAAIVADRCATPYRHLGDLVRIRGIGPRTVDGLRDWATPGPPAPDCAQAPTLPP